MKNKEKTADGIRVSMTPEWKELSDSLYTKKYAALFLRFMWAVLVAVLVTSAIYWSANGNAGLAAAHAVWCVVAVLNCRQEHREARLYARFCSIVSSIEKELSSTRDTCDRQKELLETCGSAVRHFRKVVEQQDALIDSLRKEGRP